MVLPAVALYRTLKWHGSDGETLLNGYGEQMGRRFAGIIHEFTSLSGADHLVWRNVERPYHEPSKDLGDEKAVLCIWYKDKEYTQGFRHIRYDRSLAVSDMLRACEYRRI